MTGGQRVLYGPEPKLCRACRRVTIVIVPLAEDREKSVPLDTQAPTYVLGADGRAIRSKAMASHWTTCRSAEVARAIRDGAELPATWGELLDELLDVAGVGSVSPDHREAAALVLQGYYGQRPPGAPTPKAER